MGTKSTVPELEKAAPEFQNARFLKRGSKQGTIPAITGNPWEQMTLFEVICRLSFDARIRLF